MISLAGALKNRGGHVVKRLLRYDNRNWLSIRQIEASRFSSKPPTASRANAPSLLEPGGRDLRRMADLVDSHLLAPFPRPVERSCPWAVLGFAGVSLGLVIEASTVFRPVDRIALLTTHSPISTPPAVQTATMRLNWSRSTSMQDVGRCASRKSASARDAFARNDISCRRRQGTAARFRARQCRSSEFAAREFRWCRRR